jgi:hypothetical protein
MCWRANEANASGYWRVAAHPVKGHRSKFNPGELHFIAFALVLDAPFLPVNY